jgi:hypothetical protein
LLFFISKPPHQRRDKLLGRRLLPRQNIFNW